ncbi:MAG: protein-serine/threonine phosphatase [marine bacterium B5-7]|nr:MAG: protein-serine/threonine phosphatase [marine bacterium B5-7]
MQASSSITLDIACGSDTGKVRSRNEDHIRILPEHGLAVLSDGMGGHKAGDVASRVAVDEIAEHWGNLCADIESGVRITGSKRSDDLLTAVSLANEQIHSLSKSNPEFQGMGATVIAAHFNADGLCAVHLGDSRLYRFRRGRLQQLTNDHTHAQESVRLGLMSAEEAKGGYGWNLLLKALGVDTVLEPDLIAAQLEKNDLFLLASDGLTDALGDDEIRTRLSLGDNLADSVEDLIDLANENGGPDNISVILVRIVSIDD